METPHQPFNVYTHPAGSDYACFAFEACQVLSGEQATAENEALQAMAASDEDKHPISAMAWDFSKTEKFGWCDTIKLSAKCLRQSVAKLNASSGIPMLINHNINDSIGLWTSAVIKANKLYLDGFILKGDPTGETYIRRAGKGLVKCVSIGMHILGKEWDKEKRDLIHVTEGNLYECSLTPLPLQEEARILKASAFSRNDPPPEIDAPTPGGDKAFGDLIANLNAAKAAFSGEKRCPN